MDAAFLPVSKADIILAVSRFKTPSSQWSLSTSLEVGAKAQILALEKLPVPSSTSDFRPIALLCFLAKVLKKLAYGQVIDFLAKDKILNPFHTGFNKHDLASTITSKQNY